MFLGDGDGEAKLKVQEDDGNYLYESVSSG